MLYIYSLLDYVRVYIKYIELLEIKKKKRNGVFLYIDPTILFKNWILFIYLFIIYLFIIYLLLFIYLLFIYYLIIIIIYLFIYLLLLLFLIIFFFFNIYEWINGI